MNLEDCNRVKAATAVKEHQWKCSECVKGLKRLSIIQVAMEGRKIDPAILCGQGRKLAAIHTDTKCNCEDERPSE